MWASNAQLKLVFDKIIVSAFSFDQRAMVSVLHHLAPVQNNDLICVSDGGQAVGHHDHCASVEELREILHDHPFILSIQGVCGLVQENIFRIPVYGPRYEYTLLLSLAQSGSIATSTI